MPKPKQLDAIPFNVWDDYYDDGYVPDGKIQQTYGYVEEYDLLTEEDKEAISKVVYDFLVTLPDMDGVEIAHNGEDVGFRHLTHARREKMMEELENSGLSWNGIPFSFYSES